MFPLLGLVVRRLTNAAPGGGPFFRVRIRYESAPRMLHELGQVLINALVTIDSRIVGHPEISPSSLVGFVLISRPVFTNAFRSSCRITPISDTCVAERSIGVTCTSCRLHAQVDCFRPADDLLSELLILQL